MTIKQIDKLINILDCDFIIEVDSIQYEELKKDIGENGILFGGYRKYKDSDGIELSYAGYFVLIKEKKQAL